MKIFLPHNLTINDIDALGAANISKYSRRKMFRLMYAIQEICFMAYYYNQQDWVTIYSKKLQRICRDYKPYIEILRELNIIKMSDYYLPKEQCKLYSYTAIYLDTYNIHNIDRREREYIINDINKKERREERMEKGEIENKLNSLFAYLHFNDTGASKLADQLKAQRWAEYNSSIGMEEKSVIAKNLYDQWQISKWQMKYFDGHRDDKGRFHSLLTRLPKEFRQFITFRNQFIYGLDIINSQPFFLLTLMNASFWYHADMPEDFLEVYRKYCKEPTIPAAINYQTLKMSNVLSNLIYTKVLKAISNLGNDYHIYKEKVLQGTLYDFLQEQYNIDRQAVKESFFTTIFSSNRFIGQKEAIHKREFKKAFPTVFNFISSLKTSSKGFAPSDTIKKPHAILSILLQRIESHIVIDKLTAYILKQYPNLPVYTIHDSICSTKEHIPLIEDLFSKTIFDNTGFTPKFSLECWQKTNNND